MSSETPKSANLQVISFTRMIRGLERPSYRTRMSRLGLYSLEGRWMRGDFIEVFKIMWGIARIDAEFFLT